MNVNDLVICGDILILGKWYGFLWPPTVFKMGFNAIELRDCEFATNIDLDQLMNVRMNSKL